MKSLFNERGLITISTGLVGYILLGHLLAAYPAFRFGLSILLLLTVIAVAILAIISFTEMVNAKGYRMNKGHAYLSQLPIIAIAVIIGSMILFGLVVVGG